ncbi:MAG TPA: hypothetical protein VJ974_08385 [Geopsychrobacteraceae bacterium]|nr:hypothetical protein [Geopsychrobacteraceae bacterium]
MNYQLSVHFKGDHVEVVSSGEKSYDSAVRLWDETTKVCEENACFKVLGIGNSTRAMPILHSVEHKKIFNEFNVTRNYKIAWVELNKDAVESVRFLETYLLNRGLINGQLFNDVESARKWLLDDI